ncbi:hypothetical protein ARTHRO9AX_160069 [Arthrobacter sp. 9AX]|uniref:universal stress protein n=1 Tax=Arthrobacter sp. 9AX TaxID=2653131 RepID=UPI0012F3B5AB|nr:universal stress protein [Arthrobacter sp. 9AX]VXB40559.1 hypothetical protein ARTHRO9AX_160069 [Arthrobacter sp. 9AX]
MSARKPIAVATNDSAQSRAAVQWAARRAQREGLPPLIVHVVDDRWVAEPYPFIGVLEEAGRKLLESAAVRVQEPVTIPVTTKLLTGSISGSLAKFSGKASLLVVGSGSFHLGGILADRALQAAAASKVPVAVVGPQELDGRSGVVVGVPGPGDGCRTESRQPGGSRGGRRTPGPVRRSVRARFHRTRRTQTPSVPHRHHPRRGCQEQDPGPAPLFSCQFSSTTGSAS